DELATAHEPGAGPELVAELGLNLVQVERQLAVRLDVAAHQLDHHLFVGRADAEIAALAILEAQELWAVDLPAAALLPQLGGNSDRHEDFLRAGAVHLLPDDRLDLLHDPPAERQKRVDAGCHLADVAAADEQDVRDDLRVGRSLTQRGDKRLGVTHSAAL